MSSDGNSLAKRIENVLGCVTEAEKRSGRATGSVKVIGASKRQSIENLQAASELGFSVFGENYVQELLDKQPQLSAAEWHFIGALQRNKVRKIVGQVETIQSVDRLSLAQSIHEVAAELGVVQKILVQVNIGFEDSKGGVEEGGFTELLEELKKLSSIQVCGLMALPPLTSEEKKQRSQFARCCELFEKLKTHFAEATELSMGTTADFELAIEEGATMVRVGTALFGPRSN